MAKKNKNRRQFLKNISLTALTISAIPSLAKSFDSNIKSIGTDSNCNVSTEDAYGQGPFYTPNAPTIQNNQLADQNQTGIRIIISGQVFNLDCSQVIPNTEIDIWHADDSGAYDNTGFNLRGKTTSNNQGFYIFETIKPGLYLNGSLYRPSHIHFKITPPGFPTLITQLYFEDDPWIATDAAASITNGNFDATHRIIPLIPNSNGDLEGTWDIIVNGDGVSLNSQNIHLDKGIIYNTFPNPFTNSLTIEYGVFKRSYVSIFAYDLEGRIVASFGKNFCFCFSLPYLNIGSITNEVWTDAVDRIPLSPFSNSCIIKP